jgi:capsular polysaccharide biosynthesis protein
MLEQAGFERVEMEQLSFAAQAALMAETAVLLAPHGAGLTNMIFAPAGAQVLEIADPAYPNPNFFALAGAMGHAYWMLPAEAVGEGSALTKDLRLAPELLGAALHSLGAMARPGLGAGEAPVRV